MGLSSSKDGPFDAMSSLIQRARIPKQTTTFFAGSVDEEGRGEPIEVSFTRLHLHPKLIKRDRSVSQT